MFGDNKSVVDSSMIPNGKIYNRHIALSFHRVRESIAFGIVNYLFIDGKHNPVNGLGKHWAYNDIWPTLKPIMIWPGDTIDCFENEKSE